jgi:hypothetical protein
MFFSTWFNHGFFQIHMFELQFMAMIIGKMMIAESHMLHPPGAGAKAQVRILANLTQVNV